MKQASLIFVTLLLCFTQSSFAQKEKMTREEKQEKIDARAERIKNKADYAIFRRQMLSLKEYMEERRKVPALQKEAKAPVKVLAVVDSLADDDGTQSKTLTGYIQQNIGDVSSNVYEITFDRATKTIAFIKRTGDATDVEKEEKVTEKKTRTKEKTKTVTKKNKDDDDGDDEEQEKPTRKKQKSADDDDE